MASRKIILSAKTIKLTLTNKIVTCITLLILAKIVKNTLTIKLSKIDINEFGSISPQESETINGRCDRFDKLK